MNCPRVVRTPALAGGARHSPGRRPMFLCPSVFEGGSDHPGCPPAAVCDEAEALGRQRDAAGPTYLRHSLPLLFRPRRLMGKVKRSGRRLESRFGNSGVCSAARPRRSLALGCALVHEDTTQNTAFLSGLPLTEGSILVHPTSRVPDLTCQLHSPMNHRIHHYQF